MNKLYQQLKNYFIRGARLQSIGNLEPKSLEYLNLNRLSNLQITDLENLRHLESLPKFDSKKE